MAALKGLKALSPQSMRVDGNSVALLDKYVAAVALATADTLDFRIPAGSYVYRVKLFLDDMDTAAALLFRVGYAPVDTASALVADDDYFAAAGQTTGQAGGVLECNFKPIRFDEDVWLRLTINTGPTALPTVNNEIHSIIEINQDGPK